MLTDWNMFLETRGIRTPTQRENSAGGNQGGTALESGKSLPSSVHSRGHNSRTRGLGLIFLELSRALRFYGQTNACLFLRRAMNSPTVFDLIFRFLCFEAGSHIAQATMEPNGAKVSLRFLSLLPLPPR